MNKFEYKNLTPFKWFVLENFPFIEADFDALTEWQLFCKLGKEINKIIDSQNIVGEQAETLTNAFNNLKNYIDNYFNNLDVQDEINNKLNEMAESGQLTDIIAQYLHLAGILAYDTKNDMKNASNLTNGSICKTLGDDVYNDGKGNFYKIRTITSNDVVDNINIVALQISDTLIAEKIPNYYINKNTTDINNINIKLNNIYNKNYEFKNHTTIMIGDSYGVGTTSGGTIEGWCDRVKSILEIPNEKYYKFVEGGAGFVKTGLSGHTFLTLLQNNINNITNKNDVTTIIVCGGYNDNSANIDNLNNAIQSFMNYVKQNFPNAKVYCGMVGNSGAQTDDGANIRTNLGGHIIRCYQNIIIHGGYYLNGIENIMKDYIDFMSDDNIHPNEFGYIWLSAYIVNALITGHADFITGLIGSTVTSKICNDFLLYSAISNNLVTIESKDLLITLKQPTTIRDDIVLGSVKMACYRGTGNMAIPVKFYLQTTDTKFYGGMGLLKIHNNGDVQLLVQQLTNDGNAYIETQNVYIIYIQAFNYTLSSSQC